MTDYVREYFDSRASAWLEQAYLADPLPAKYRIGDERVRVTIEGVVPERCPPEGRSSTSAAAAGSSACMRRASAGR